MDREIWTAACAHRLQRHWRTIHPDVLQEVAGELWDDEYLRGLMPDAAAVTWLEPVACGHVQPLHIGKTTAVLP